ncbi:MAG: hypothetical protein Q7S81_01190 [bacterium]|nr:hypothetical protein [bacterium]
MSAIALAKEEAIYLFRHPGLDLGSRFSGFQIKFGMTEEAVIATLRPSDLSVRSLTKEEALREGGSQTPRNDRKNKMTKNNSKIILSIETSCDPALKSALLATASACEKIINALLVTGQVKPHN